MSWTHRPEFCIGAARGLHTELPRESSTNILLGDGYVAKVADFGLSRIDRSFGVVPVIELSHDRINNHLAEWVVESASPGRAFRSQAIVLKKENFYSPVANVCLLSSLTSEWPICACSLLLNLSYVLQHSQYH